MQNFDELHVLDAARLNAMELGKIIKNFLPEECQLHLMDALVTHMGKKNHNGAERLFRTFESGLMEGLVDMPAARTVLNIEELRSET